jgi:hypothetical protein
MYPNGYGAFFVGAGVGERGAHRVSYSIHFGEIGEGLTVDHLCHTRSVDCPSDFTCAHRRCVNPLHMELVTNAENIRRSYANAAAIRRNRTHCIHGHEYTDENTIRKSDGARGCRVCSRKSVKESMARARARVA